jgi:hypothetical protein
VSSYRVLAYLALSFGAACASSENVGPVEPAWSCPTTTAGLQTQVFQPTCGSAGCHGASNPAMGLDLVSPGLESRLIDVSSNGCGQILVTPGSSASSYLFQKLTQSAPTCGDPMPLGGATLPQQQTSCIGTWIASMGSSPGTGGASGTGGTGTGGTSSGTGTGGTGSGAGTGGSGTGTGGSGVGTGGTGTGSTTGTGGTGTGGSSTGGTTGTGGTGTGGSSTGGTTGTGGRGTGGATGTGGSGCGPTVAFASQVQPIFTTNCTSGCHSGTRPAAGMSLASGSAYANLVNVRASSTCTTLVRVSPGAVAMSYLMNKLTGVGICSGSQMPKAGGSLPSSQLQAINGWICEGAPNN